MDKNSVVVVCDSYYLNVKNDQSADFLSRSPSPNRSLKGFNLFRVISQKLGRGIRKSKEDKCTSSDDDEDSNSSTNSVANNKVPDPKNNVKCNCDYFYKGRGQGEGQEKSGPGKGKASGQEPGKKCLKFSNPCRYHSSGSDTCSSNEDSSEFNEADRKTSRSHFSLNNSYASSSSSSADSYKPSTAPLRKGLKNLNINSKSLSCFSISQLKEASERGSKEKRTTKKSPQKILRQPPVHTYVRGISGLPTLKVINSRGCHNNQYSRG